MRAATPSPLSEPRMRANALDYPQSQQHATGPGLRHAAFFTKSAQLLVGTVRLERHPEAVVGLFVGAADCFP